MGKIDASGATTEDLKNYWLGCTLDLAGTLETLESGYDTGYDRQRRLLLDDVHNLKSEIAKVEAELARRERLGK